MFGLSLSYNNGRSGYGAGRDSLADILAEGTKMRAFYDALYPGTVRVEFYADCVTCTGRGRVGKGRKNVRFPKYVECKACCGLGRFPLPLVG